jgi:hypothetical protein
MGEEKASRKIAKTKTLSRIGADERGAGNTNHKGHSTPSLRSVAQDRLRSTKEKAPLVQQRPSITPLQLTHL